MAFFCTPICALRLPPEAPVNQDTLVVVIGGHRGGDLAWHSLQKHVLHPWNADLAVFVEDGKSYHQNTLTMNAQYLWVEPEHDDWGEVLETIPEIESQMQKEPSWREHMCNLAKQKRITIHNLWGGVAFGSCGDPEGSGGILLAYRWRVYQEIEKLMMEGTHYSHVVLTRSDFLYGCDIQQVANFEGGVTVPDVEGWGGYTDRFAFMQDRDVLPSLNVTRHVLANLEEMPNLVNLESILKWHWGSLHTTVHQFKHPAFTVKLPEDQTRWREGKTDEIMQPYNLLVKYPAEFMETQSTCGKTQLVKELSSMAQEIKLDAPVNLYISKADAHDMHMEIKDDVDKFKMPKLGARGDYVKVLCTDNKGLGN